MLIAPPKIISKKSVVLLSRFFSIAFLKLGILAMLFDIFADAGGDIIIWPVILSSILQAGATLRKISDAEFENRITIRLCRQLVKIPVFRDGPLDIRPQTGILSFSLDEDKLDGSTDLLVSCGLGHEVYFILEAKRLRVRLPNGRLVAGNNEYVNNGMMRFITGQYAPFMETGAMLGYVFDGETGKARSGIDGYVQKKAKKLKLKPPRRLLRSQILADMPIDESRHDLRKRSFTIYHIFFAV